ncbi:hypothetical protein KUCAC02_003685 [Chaenocephalus aceratus]|uniref:Uncharacterized protein n=1 Tax=Chaenocephalus aceratus TaxID=36190 RepID=A0ACB9WL92_CHAAC|nr:hypothetical protein KUCAC02_003685 [Chaenocephalus aceratus]
MGEKRAEHKDTTHGRLEGRESHKKWLEPSSKAAVTLETLVCNKTLCNDILKLSGAAKHQQWRDSTASLSSFAPKMYVFSDTGMLCRILIAALHFNENANRSVGKSNLRICPRTPGRRSEGFPHPEKADFVKQHLSRFKK